MLRENEQIAFIVILLALFLAAFGLLTGRDIITYGGFGVLLAGVLVVSILEWLQR